MDNIGDRIAAGLLLAGGVVVSRLLRWWSWHSPIILLGLVCAAFIFGFALGDRFFAKVRWW